MIIYKITNNINGKIYIGQTIETLYKRWNRHCSDSNKNTMAITRAIKKYGKENFSIQKICDCSDQNQLDNSEKYYISFFNSRLPNGYNILEGGNGGSLLKETKDKISKRLKGVPKSLDHIINAANGYKRAAKINPEILKRPKRGQFNSETRKGLSRNREKTSKFMGVVKDGSKWRCEIYNLGKRLTETYLTEEAAARAYDFYLIKNKLEPINFPSDIWDEDKLKSFRSKKIRKSPYYGVREHRKKYDAMIWFEKRRKFLGSFDTEIEAAKAVDSFLRLNNLSARNFPENKP